MFKGISILVLAGMLGMVMVACDNSGSDDIASKSGGGVVELYLLKSYETYEDSFQIDETTVVTRANPLIPYSDIISYDKNEYILKISDSCLKTIQGLNLSVHGLAFSVLADNELVYTGYFWPIYSSIICDCIIIDPINVDLNDGLKIELGYPGTTVGTTISDVRNGNQILKIFRRDDKLIGWRN